MSRLRAPLNEHLADPHDETAVQQGWQAIRSRRERTSKAPRWVAGIALAAAASAGLFFWSNVGEPRALHLADGAPLVPGTIAPRGYVWSLSDGSTIHSQPIGQLEVGESSPEALHLVLRGGTIDLDVRSHGQPKWSVDCGLATVEITGTKLSIVRLTREVRVTVNEGSVRVKSDLLTPPVQYVRAGETLTVTRPEAPSTSEGPTDRPVRRRAPRPPLPPAVETKETEELSVDTLLERADAARRAGRLTEAIDQLRLVEARDHRTKGALAAFTRGRILLDELDDPEAAAEAIDRALSSSLPGSLKESAMARAVEAQGRLGNLTAAKLKAADYLAAYPEGPHREQVKKWVK